MNGLEIGLCMALLCLLTFCVLVYAEMLLQRRRADYWHDQTVKLADQWYEAVQRAQRAEDLSRSNSRP